MASRNNIPNSSRYFKAKLKPLKRPMFWISTGFLTLCFVSLSIYWKNPEWITEEIEEPATLEDIEINNADLSKTGEVNREELVPDGTQQQINPNQSSDEAIASDDNIALESENLADPLQREQELGIGGSEILNPDGFFLGSNSSKNQETQTGDFSKSIKPSAPKPVAQTSKKSPNYSSSSRISQGNTQSVTSQGNPLQDALNQLSTENSRTNLEQSVRRSNTSTTETSNLANNNLSNSINNYRSSSQNNSSSSPSPTSLPSSPNYLNNSSTLGNFTSPNQPTWNQSTNNSNPSIGYNRGFNQFNQPRVGNNSSFNQFNQPRVSNNSSFNQFNQPRVNNNSSFNSNLTSPGVQPFETTQTRRNQPQFNNTKLQPFQQQQGNLNQFKYNSQFQNYQGTTQGLNNTDYGNQFQNFQSQQQNFN